MATTPRCYSRLENFAFMMEDLNLVTILHSYFRPKHKETKED